jgi:hypothetical protein
MPSLPELTGWERIDLPRAFVYSTVVASATGFVVGGLGDDGPAAWSSTDGEAWRAETVPGNTRDLTDGAVWGDRLLMVGTGQFRPMPEACGHESILNSWVRDPGGIWTQAPFQQAFCAGGRPEVAVAGGVAVVIGTGSGDVPYAWSSADGLRWVESDVDFGNGMPTAIRATRAGFFVFGMSRNGSWVARSTDGTHWTEPARLTGGPNAIPLGTAVIGDRIVVIVRDPEEATEAISSADGETWIALRADGQTDGLSRVEQINSGLAGMGDNERGQALTVSADGTSWRPVELPRARQGAQVMDVAIWRGRAVVLGWVEADNLQAAAWVGPASLVVP